MNMGGGILLKTVGRAVGSTTPAASTSFCSACTGHVTRRSSSLQRVCHTCQNATLSHQGTGAVTPIECEGWEFADDFPSDNVTRSMPAQDGRFLFSPNSSVSSNSSGCNGTTPPDNCLWHVFGLPPSYDEACAATSDLQAAFTEFNMMATDDETRSTCPRSLEHERPSPRAISIDSEEELHCTEWAEPQLLMSNTKMVQVIKSPVQEAFQLLKNDPDVKDAVISLVSDPDVWHVMMKNDKVQELRHRYRKNQEQQELDAIPSPEESSKEDKGGHDYFGGVSCALRAIIEMSTQVICRVQDDLCKFIMSIFSLLTGANKLPPSEKEQPINKDMASTVMLAVLVVTVVLLKRVHA